MQFFGRKFNSNFGTNFGTNFGIDFGTNLPCWSYSCCCDFRKRNDDTEYISFNIGGCKKVIFHTLNTVCLYAENRTTVLYTEKNMTAVAIRERADTFIHVFGYLSSIFLEFYGETFAILYQCQ